MLVAVPNWCFSFIQFSGIHTWQQEANKINEYFLSVNYKVIIRLAVNISPTDEDRKRPCVFGTLV